ncbi:DUF2489 domain-containing protein [Glaciimonas sp. PAMC28666]|uniref:DUF2489 domain-containing protein n=1 Tax=Glaciimonas sp. PAMC28666 TaxID=2807626 RepID=UPI001965CFF1|nr:DUF2489 domain-containing protein [Glaciimonas sp. PAMC28666]QRX81606.1 DUF2489 domain-containing protein [Glaciimonas sp. PAMC28666]
MKNRKASNEIEEIARQNLVTLAEAMLDGDLSFFEGAIEVLTLKEKVGGVVDRDPDFDAFLVIRSETDHLPLKSQHSLWSSESLKHLEPEYLSAEEWAKSFAPQACKNLINRFKLLSE